jgi:hypothetical protein
MDEKYSQIAQRDSKFAEHLAEMLNRQVNTSFEAIVSTDKWLTQHNFLVNAGGAAAILSYLSSAPENQFAIVPLIIFILGVVASGIEIRYLLKVHGELHQDAIRRRGGFVSDELTVGDAANVQAPTKRSKNINHYSGVVAQWSFVIGCATGIIGYICK